METIPQQNQRAFPQKLQPLVEPPVNPPRLSKSIVLAGGGPVISNTGPVLNQTIALDQYQRPSYGGTSSPIIYRSANPNIYPSSTFVPPLSPANQVNQGFWTANGNAQGQIPTGLIENREGFQAMSKSQNIVNQGNLTTSQANVTYQWQPVRKIEYITVPVVSETPKSLVTENKEALKAMKSSQSLTTGQVNVATNQVNLSTSQANVTYQWQAVRKIEYVTIPVLIVPSEGRGGSSEELERLKALLKEKDQMFLALRAQNEILIQENKDLSHQSVDLKNILEGADNEKKDHLKRAGAPQGPPPQALLDEIERLKVLLAEKTGAFDRLMDEHNQMRDEYESRLSLMSSGNDGADKFIAELKSQYETKISNLIKDHENRINMLTSEFESRISEKTGLEKMIADLKASYESRISVLIKENEGYILEIKTYESKLIVITQERDDLLARIRELEKIIEGLKGELEKARDLLVQYENKIAILSGEVNRMKNLGQGKTSEIEEFKRRTVELESSNANYSITMSKYESQISTLSIRCENGLALVACLCAEIESLRGRYVERIETN